MIESNQTWPVSTDRAIADDLEVVAVGGGQADLAMGTSWLGRRFAILDAARSRRALGASAGTR